MSTLTWISRMVTFSPNHPFVFRFFKRRAYISQRIHGNRKIFWTLRRRLQTLPSLWLRRNPTPPKDEAIHDAQLGHQKKKTAATPLVSGYVRGCPGKLRGGGGWNAAEWKTIWVSSIRFLLRHGFDISKDCRGVLWMVEMFDDWLNGEEKTAAVGRKLMFVSTFSRFFLRFAP